MQADNQSENCEVCVALANLYAVERPISARAYAMKAECLGAQKVKLPFAGRDALPESDPSGSYLLGREFCSVGRYNDAIPFLQAAGFCKDRNTAAAASFYMADLLSHVPSVDRDKVNTWYKRAEALGNPDILPCVKDVKATYVDASVQTYAEAKDVLGL